VKCEKSSTQKKEEKEPRKFTMQKKIPKIAIPRVRNHKTEIIKNIKRKTHRIDGSQNMYRQSKSRYLLLSLQHQALMELKERQEVENL